MVRLCTQIYIDIFGKLIHRNDRRNDSTKIKRSRILRLSTKRREKIEYYQFLSQISDQKRAIHPRRSVNPTGLSIIATDSVRRNRKVSRRKVILGRKNKLKRRNVPRVDQTNWLLSLFTPFTGPHPDSGFARIYIYIWYITAYV